MIRAVIFDLDGTLVQTERLKAISYARAAVEMCPRKITEDEVISAFKEVVGLSRKEVATALVERFNLEDAAVARMVDFGVETPWQAFVQVRLSIYNQMLADPGIIRDNQWPHNVDLLHQARSANCKIGLATMSECTQARRVLDILDMNTVFDFVATRDDVDHGKPDPEIYLLVSSELEIPPQDCLVIEDSLSGVKAALAAGMACIAVSTPFTFESLHAAQILEERWIVDDPETLKSTVQDSFEFHQALDK